jgi:hypothetical protein
MPINNGKAERQKLITAAEERRKYQQSRVILGSDPEVVLTDKELEDLRYITSLPDSPDD